jgi:hypothetical protein
MMGCYRDRKHEKVKHHEQQSEEISFHITSIPPVAACFALRQTFQHGGCASSRGIKVAAGLAIILARAQDAGFLRSCLLPLLRKIFSVALFARIFDFVADVFQRLGIFGIGGLKRV